MEKLGLGDLANDDTTAERMRIRRHVQRWGLKVLCLLCKKHLRHRPETNGRLRYRPCPWCGLCSLKSWRWVKGHIPEANRLRKEHLEGRVCFQAPLL